MHNRDIDSRIKRIRVEKSCIKFTHLNEDDDVEGFSSSTAAIWKMNSQIQGDQKERNSRQLRQWSFPSFPLNIPAFIAIPLSPGLQTATQECTRDDFFANFFLVLFMNIILLNSSFRSLQLHSI